jgi:hypothetical protein
LIQVTKLLLLKVAPFIKTTEKYIVGTAFERTVNVHMNEDSKASAADMKHIIQLAM